MSKQRKVFKEVLLDGWSHFGSGRYRASVDLRGGEVIPGTKREKRTSFVVEVFGDVIGSSSPVSSWRDVFRPDGRVVTYSPIA